MSDRPRTAEPPDGIAEERPTDVARAGDDAAALADARLGRLLADRFRIVRSIGAGGMGEVYEAEQVRVKRRLAVKFLHPRYATRGSMLARFRREAEAAGRLEHENIAAVMDYGDDEGVPYLVMEYLEGVDLGRLVKHAGGVLPVLRSVAIILQACRGIAAAHGAGIVHRDLKPQNLFVCRRGDGSDLVKVLDFGVAKLIAAEDGAATHTGAALGTPCYMSPEQARGDKPIDGRTDLYSLGLIVYECLTGVRPFSGDSYNAILHQVLTRVPEPLATLRPGLPSRLVTAVEQAMAFAPGDRWESATAFGEELRRVLAELRRPGDDSTADDAPLDPGMTTEAVATAPPGRHRAGGRGQGARPAEAERRSDAAGRSRARASGSHDTATPWVESAAPERGRALSWLLGAGAIAATAGLLWWSAGARGPAPGGATTPTGASPSAALASNASVSAAAAAPSPTASAAPSASERTAAGGPSRSSTAATAERPPSASRRPSASPPKPTSGGSHFDRDNPYD